MAKRVKKQLFKILPWSVVGLMVIFLAIGVWVNLPQEPVKAGGGSFSALSGAITLSNDADGNGIANIGDTVSVTASITNSDGDGVDPNESTVTANLSVFGCGAAVAMDVTDGLEGNTAEAWGPVTCVISAGSADVAINTQTINITYSDADDLAASFATTALAQAFDNQLPVITGAGAITITTDNNSDGIAAVNDVITYAIGTESTGDTVTWRANLSAYGLSGSFAPGTVTIIPDNDDGAFTANEIVTDNAGNIAGAPSAITTGFNIDNQIPVITGAGAITITTDNNSDGIAAVNDVITYAIGTESTGDTVTWRANLSAYGLSGSFAPGTVTIIPDNDDGAFTANEIVTDNAGNVAGAPSAITTGFNIDNQIPTITSPGAFTLTTDLGGEGIASIGDTVTYTIGTEGTGDTVTWRINLSAYGLSASQAPGAVVLVPDNDDGMSTPNETVTDNAGNVAGAPSPVFAAINIDNVAPTVTAARISVTGATGLLGAFKFGNTAVPTWNNTAGGDNNADVASVKFNAADFRSVDTNLSGSNAAGTWTASLSGAMDSQDDLNNNVTVTVKDDANNQTIVTDNSNYTVDTIAPIVTPANISVQGASGLGWAFKIADLPIYYWNTAGDGETDSLNSVSFNAADFKAIDTNLVGGAGGGQYSTAGSGLDSQDDINNNVTVTVTDNAGNVTVTLDNDNYTVDTIAPVVTNANISISGGSGTGGAYILGNSVVATWNAAADGNTDISSGRADLAGWGGDMFAVMNDSGAGCDLVSGDGSWCASATVGAGIDSAMINTAITGTDDAGNSTGPISDTSNATIDTIVPTVVSVTPNDLLLTPADSGANKFYLDILYSENMLGTSVPSVTFTPDLTSTILTLNVGGSSWIAADTYRVSYDVAVVTPENTTLTDIDIAAAQDHMGNTQTSYFGGGESVVVDTKGPVVTIVQPSNLGQTKMATPVIVTTDETAHCIYYLDGAPGFVNLAWDATELYHTGYISGLTAGSHNISVSCSDIAAGNVGLGASTWTKVDPGRTVLLGTNGQGTTIGNLYEINSEDGTIVRTIGSTGACLTGLAVDPTTNYLYGVSTSECSPTDFSSIFRVNATTGTATKIAQLSGPITGNGCSSSYAFGSVGDITFDTAGNMYGADCNGDFYRINKVTGATTLLSSSAGWGNGIAYDSVGGGMYLLQTDDDSLGYLTTAGAYTDLGTIPNGSGSSVGIGAADIDSNHMLFAVRYTKWNATPRDLVVIDTNTPAITSIGLTTNAAMNGMSAIAFYTPASGGGGATAATPICSLSINSGAATTNSLSVSLAVSSTTTVTDMLISNDANFVGASWEAYAAAKGWTLGGTPGVPGSKTVYAMVRDSSNQLSNICTATINYAIAAGGTTGGGGGGGGGGAGSTSTPTLSTSDLLNQYNAAPAETLPSSVKVGQLIKRADMSAIYFIDQDNRRHAFPNEATYLSWFADFSGINVVSAETLAAIPLGQNVTMRPGTYLIKITSDPKVYAVEPFGKIRWVETEDIAIALFGADWASKVVDVDVSFFANYMTGDSIATKKHPTGSVISYAGDPATYYIENGVKKYISSDVFTQNVFQNKFAIRNVSADITYNSGDNFPALPLETLMAIK